jgi:protein required for attachment to host cells
MHQFFDAHGGLLRHAWVESKPRAAQAVVTSRKRCGAGRGRLLAIETGMYRTCIAIVDASRARLFEHRRTATAEGLEDGLEELHDLVNPARRLRPSELFSGAPGSGRTGNLQYGMDDHRAEHLDQFDHAFARDVTAAIASQLRERPAQRLILCASPRMLGVLRTKLTVTIPVDEMDRDLVKLEPPQLWEQLVSYGLLPERARASA